MSRRSGRRPPPEQEKPRRIAFVPVTQVPHLAVAARRRGEQARLIRVDLPEPPKVHTPGRGVGQWLMSGEQLKPPAPQYLTEFEIEQMEMDRDGIDAPWEGGFDR